MGGTKGAKTDVRGAGKAESLLVDAGVVTREQLEEASRLRRAGDPRDVGRILLSLGYVGESDLAKALARRLGIDYVELTEASVDPSAARLVDREVLRRHRALPLRLEKGRLVVAMADPTNLYATEDITMLSGRGISPVVATEGDIDHAANKVFAIGEDVTRLLEDAADGPEEPNEVELGGDVTGEGPAVRLVGSILQRAVGDGASDVHVEPRAKELRVRYRVDGVLRDMLDIPSGLREGVVARLKVLADLDIAERRVPQDGRLSARLGGRKAELRVATLPTVFGEKVVLRLLETANVETDLRGLGFAPEMLARYRGIFRRPYGTTLVTGPTGSGKSTTLYATLGELDAEKKNIVTVEDPVEYRMPGVNQVQVNQKVGLGFAAGLRSILRTDPDVVMIGEIRDRETARASIEAALTGHLVLATLHTNDAPAAITRLTDMGVEPFLTASAVDCVIAQRLARRLCEGCKKPARPGGKNTGVARLSGARRATFFEPIGCDRCGGTGYRGRIGIYELMVVDERIRDLVLRRVPTAEVGRTAEAAGMVRLRDDGVAKAAQGITTIEEVLRTVI